jgi:hypothetical protein
MPLRFTESFFVVSFSAVATATTGLAVHVTRVSAIVHSTLMIRSVVYVGFTA